MTLEAIKAAIAELPETEKASLAAWLIQQDAAAWDRQIEADFSEGDLARHCFRLGTPKSKPAGPCLWKNSSVSRKRPTRPSDTSALFLDT